MIDLGSLVGASTLGLFVLGASSVCWSLRLQADCRRELTRMKSVLERNAQQAEKIELVTKKFLENFTTTTDDA